MGKIPWRKHEKSHENALENSQLMAHEISIPNAIKFNGVVKYNLMGSSCFGKTQHENYHYIFMGF